MTATLADPTFTPASQDGLGATAEQFDSIYKNLPGSGSSIRLVRLSAAGKEDADSTIVCTLESATLDSQPEYDAISYTWGDATEMKPIILNGESITIRAHLWEMLVRLRNRNWSDLLWVDVLCIRQDSIEDKNQQVAKIGQIFAAAQNVLAWVGLHADDSLPFTTLLAVFDDIRRLDPNTWIDIMDRIQMGLKDTSTQMVPVKYRHEMLSLGGFTVDKSAPLYNRIIQDIENSEHVIADPETSVEDIAELQILRHKFQESLMKFMGREYFFRTWVRQELILAREVYLFCGDIIIGEAAFWPGAQFLVELITRDCEEVKLQQDIAMDGYLVQQKMRMFLHDNAILNCQKYRQERNECLKEQKPWGIDLKTLMKLSDQTRCRDPRDKIYALRSLLQPGENISKMEVDYNLNKTALFHKLLPYCRSEHGVLLDGQEACTLGRILNIGSQEMIEEASSSAETQRLVSQDQRVDRTMCATAPLKLVGAVVRVKEKDLYGSLPRATTAERTRRYQLVQVMRYSWGFVGGEPDDYIVDAQEDVKAADQLWQVQAGGGVTIVSHPAPTASTDLAAIGQDVDIMLPFRKQTVYGTVTVKDNESHEGQHENCFDCPRELARHRIQALVNGFVFQVTGDLPISSPWVTAPERTPEQLLKLMEMLDKQLAEDEEEIDWDEEYDDEYDYDDENGNYDDGSDDGNNKKDKPKAEEDTQAAGLMEIPFDVFAELYAYGVLPFELVKEFKH